MLGFVSEGAFNAAASLTKPRGLLLILLIMRNLIPRFYITFI